MKLYLIITRESNQRMLTSLHPEKKNKLGTASFYKKERETEKQRIIHNKGSKNKE